MKLKYITPFSWASDCRRKSACIRLLIAERSLLIYLSGAPRKREMSSKRRVQFHSEKERSIPVRLCNFCLHTRRKNQNIYILWSWIYITDFTWFWELHQILLHFGCSELNLVKLLTEIQIFLYAFSFIITVPRVLPLDMQTSVEYVQTCKTSPVASFLHKTHCVQIQWIRQ